MSSIHYHAPDVKWHRPHCALRVSSARKLSFQLSRALRTHCARNRTALTCWPRRLTRNANEPKGGPNSANNHLRKNVGRTRAGRKNWGWWIFHRTITCVFADFGLINNLLSCFTGQPARAIFQDGNNIYIIHK